MIYITIRHCLGGFLCDLEDSAHMSSYRIPSAIKTYITFWIIVYGVALYIQNVCFLENNHIAPLSCKNQVVIVLFSVFFFSMLFIELFERPFYQHQDILGAPFLPKAHPFYIAHAHLNML